MIERMINVNSSGYTPPDRGRIRNSYKNLIFRIKIQFCNVRMPSLLESTTIISLFLTIRKVGFSFFSNIPSGVYIPVMNRTAAGAFPFFLRS